MDWLEQFRRESAPVITEPFFLCLAEAIAWVESACGTRPILGPGGGEEAQRALNEIGYKAVPGKPAIRVATHENPQPEIAGTPPALQQAGFRLFRDRAEQAASLLWLLRSSSYYETARLLFVLAFYAAYAPGRTAGARELLRVFNQIAAGGAHTGVRPFQILPGTPHPDALNQLNHAAARQAVRLFAELTAVPR